MSERHKVIIFGGTGHAGRFILQRAVDDDLDVTAFVRTPSKLPEDIRKKVHVVQGNVLERCEVEDAIKGYDVVLSSLGKGLNFKPTTLMSDGVRNIVSGMKIHGVKKLVVLCGGGSLPNYWMPWFIQNIVADHKRIVKMLKEESEDDIDWVTLHAPLILPTNNINNGYMLEKNDLNGRIFVNAGEIADFMMKYISHREIFTEYRNNQIGICSGPARITSTQLKALIAFAVIVLFSLILHHFNLI